ncbi:MAG TPA: glycosyl hydrolase family 28 protein [Anaerolineae bacterium]|nr:glycosyl hydrolase family 28 protein [Anaerolineae bacterium]
MNSQQHAYEFDVRAYGAAGDGRTLDSPAIQQAIEAAHAAGGGVVHAPPGIYRCGTLELRSAVTLELDRDATILGSAKLADYRCYHWPALITAKDQRDIAIIGAGTIDGNSPELVREFDRIKASGNGLDFFPHAVEGADIEMASPFGTPYTFNPYQLQREGVLLERIYGSFTRPTEAVRPQVIEFNHCTHVTVRDITLCNAANWVETYRNCEDLLIERIKVRSTQYWNNDGLDLVDCKRVRVLDCDINSADDALCLKSEFYGTGCEDITIARCTLASRASALKFGTASQHGFRRIHVSDIAVRNTYRSVVAIQSVDGAVVEDITVERARGTNTGNAFAIRLGHRNPHKPVGSIKDIVLRDIEVDVPPQPPDYHSETGTPHNLIPGSITGIPGARVEDVLLENVQVRYGGRADRAHAEIPLDALDSVPEKVTDYPEFTMWGELPAWAAYIRHASGVTLRNVRFTLGGPDFRPAIVAADAPGLTLENLDIAPCSGEPVIVLKDSPEATLHNVAFPDGAAETVQILGGGR